MLCSLQKLGINLCKFDEMDCLIRGLHYLALHCPNECYYWRNPKQESTCKVPFDLGPDPYPYIIVNIGSGVSILLVESATSFRRIGGTSVGRSDAAACQVFMLGCLQVGGHFWGCVQCWREQIPLMLPLS